VVSDDQPDAARDRPGALGVAERFAVLPKPVNAGGGKGPQFKTDARRGEGPGDGQPINSEECSETAGGVPRKRRQKPAIASMPCTTRSAVRTSWPCLCSVSRQQGRSGRGRSGLCGTSRHMGCSGGWANWRLRSAGDLPTGADQKSVHTEGQRQAQAAGHLDLARSGLHDGSVAGTGTDLRSRPSTRAVCLPSWAQRQQAVVEVEALVFRGHSEVVDADLTDYFGSIPHAELLKIGSAAGSLIGACCI